MTPRTPGGTGVSTAGLGEGNMPLGALAVLGTNVVMMVAAAAPIALSLQRRIARASDPRKAAIATSHWS